MVFGEDHDEKVSQKSSVKETELLGKTYLESTLGLDKVALEQQQLTGNNKDSDVHFFLGQDGTLGGAGISPNKTHLKIAQLFKTTGHSTVGNNDTQCVAEQLAKLKESTS